MTEDPGAASGAPMSDRMQSLLSRAVEDQLTEQRQVAGALGELRSQLSRMANEIEALRSTAGGQGGAPAEAAMAAVAAEVREAVRLLAERLDGVGRLVQQRGVDLAEIRAAVDELQTGVRSHNDALQGVTQGIGALPAFGERIGSLQDTFGQLGERLSGLEEMNASVGSVNQRLEALDANIRELRSAFTGMAARIAELPARGDIEATIAKSTSPLNEVTTRLSRIETSVPGLVKQIDELRDPLNAAEDRDDRLREELSRFAAAVTADGDSINEKLSDLQSAVQRVQSTAGSGTAPSYDDSRVQAALAGLHEQVAGIAQSVMAARSGQEVSVEISAAVAQAEQRINAHVDEAVLALAEALLRRRASRFATATDVGRPDAPPSGSTGAGDVVADQDDELADEVASSVGAVAGDAELVDAELEGQDLEDDETDDHAREQDAMDEATGHSHGPTSEQTQPWQVPAPHEDQPSSAEPARKKRPWWRPSD